MTYAEFLQNRIDEIRDEEATEEWNDEIRRREAELIRLKGRQAEILGQIERGQMRMMPFVTTEQLLKGVQEKVDKAQDLYESALKYAEHAETFVKMLEDQIAEMTG